MRIEFLLGPAGSGKTFRCIAEARQALEASPEGLPLLFIAPKQATYQLERQLLGDGSVSGYTRLQILSFERLARWIFQRPGRRDPELLSEEGRVMVLRALLARHEKELKVFRASARSAGFSKELSRLLVELQQSRIGWSRLRELAANAGRQSRLTDKLHDVALLMEAYRKWLSGENIEDDHQLLELAADLLEQSPEVRFGAIWLDGFARLTIQEQRLLRILASRSEKMTLAFCLRRSEASSAWHSLWSAVEESFCRLRTQLESVAGAECFVSELGHRDAPSPQPSPQMGEREKTAPASELDLFGWATARIQTRLAPSPIVHTSSPRALPRQTHTRFANAELKHLEEFWEAPTPYPGADRLTAIRLVECPEAEAEATFAAREILRYVRGGGRFRETAVIVRELDAYYDVLRRVFLRYQIPFFLDRREPIAHHPLAELTRGALCTIAFNWRQRDWFSALKSGLVGASEQEIDRLENEALARGWERADWQRPLELRNERDFGVSIEKLRQRLVAPFLALAEQLGAAPTGKELAEALLRFWNELNLQQQLERWSAESIEHGPMHLTIWEQMQEWARNLALAFRHHAQPLQHWIPIVESGLENLSVGVIPPVLDQVLLGAVDRSRNPDLQRVFVLGLNEGIFPAPWTMPPILSELDRALLEENGAFLGMKARAHIAQERFFGYIACTRARDQLTLTYASRGVDGAQQNASSLVTHVQRLFPQLRTPEIFATTQRWAEAEHCSELIAPLLKARSSSSVEDGGGQVSSTRTRDEDEHEPAAFAAEVITTLTNLPALAPVIARLGSANPASPALSRDLARLLYGRIHNTSVSALERFGACPFSFFVESGLRAEEREEFDLDARQRGTFQHKVLEEFHRWVKAERQTWHNLTPEIAREQIGRIADAVMETFEDGMLKRSHENRFIALAQKERLQRFIGVLAGWMRQYAFEPAEVELRFGLDHGGLPAWRIEATDGYALALRGSIDRVDLFRPRGSESTWCVVMDYKLSGKKLDEIFMAHGIQLQLPGYLAALVGVDGVEEFLKADQLRPVGVFFVNLSGNYEAAANRNELGNDPAVHKSAFGHIGRFDAEALAFLDNRDAVEGDQFSYKRNAGGELGAQTKGPMPTAEFQALLAQTQDKMREFGRRIFDGDISVDPYKKGGQCACDWCEHAAICRIDSWTHHFRKLNKSAVAEEEE